MSCGPSLKLRLFAKASQRNSRSNLFCTEWLTNITRPNGLISMGILLVVLLVVGPGYWFETRKKRTSICHLKIIILSWMMQRKLSSKMIAPGTMLSLAAPAKICSNESAMLPSSIIAHLRKVWHINCDNWNKVEEAVWKPYWWVTQTLVLIPQRRRPLAHLVRLQRRSTRPTMWNHPSLKQTALNPCPLRNYRGVAKALP